MATADSRSRIRRLAIRLTAPVLGVAIGYALAMLQSEDPDWARYTQVLWLLLALQVAFGITTLAVVAGYRQLRSNRLGNESASEAPTQADSSTETSQEAAISTPAQLRELGSPWSTTALSLALVSVLGTVALFWLNFPLNTVWGTAFVVPAAICGFRALRVSEPAASGALALVLFSTWLQALLWVLYLLPTLFWGGQ